MLDAKARVRCALRQCLGEPTERLALVALKAAMLAASVPLAAATVIFLPGRWGRAEAAVIIDGQPEVIELRALRRQD